MALLKVICWAIIFITRLRFPPGKSLATIKNKEIRNTINIYLKGCIRKRIFFKKKRRNENQQYFKHSKILPYFETAISCQFEELSRVLKHEKIEQLFLNMRP